MRVRTLLVLALVAGCTGPASGTHIMDFPTIRVHLAPPDIERVTITGHTEGRDISNATIESYLVAGRCPPAEDVPRTWLDRHVLAMPGSGRFSFDYEIVMNASMTTGSPFAAMVGARHPQTIPGRGWCVEFVAGGNETGTPVYP